MPEQQKPAGRADEEALLQDVEARLRRMLAAKGEIGQEHLRQLAQEIKATLVGELTSLVGELSSVTRELHGQITSLSGTIHDAKTQIAALRPDEIHARHVPDATDELEAVVGATEQATETILEAAEKIEEVSGELESETGERVVEQVTRIYEACNFQDITGQRIAKAIGALQDIEGKVDGLLRIFGDRLAVDCAPVDLEEVAEDGRAGDRKLMNGPQLPGAAIDQAAVDALLGGDD